MPAAPDAPPPQKPVPPVCSFCGRGASEFQKIVGGKSGAQICDRCIREYYAQVEQMRRNEPRSKN
jgi:ClpX C4-type zinc finger protein